MRKLLLALAFLVVAGAIGIGLGDTGVGPVAGALIGAVLVAVVLLMRVSTERLVGLTVALLILTITWNGIRFAGGALGNVFMVLAFASVVAHATLEKRPIPLPRWLLLAGLGFALAALVTMVFPPGVEVANLAQVHLKKLIGGTPIFLGRQSDVIAVVKFELSAILIPLLMLMAGTSRERCTWLLDLWTMSALVSAAVGVADFLGVHVAPVAIIGTRSSGLTVHPNYLALASAMAIPTAMLWWKRDSYWRLAGMLAVPMLLGGIYVSGSRAGAVVAVLAVGGTAVTVPGLRQRFAAVLPVAGMVLVVLLMFTRMGHHVLEQVRLTGSDPTIAGSDAQRSDAARTAIDQIRARPVSGVGFTEIASAHDIYLEVLASGGVIAMMAFLTFLGGLAGSLRRGLAGTQRDEVTAAAIAVAVWLVNGIFDNQVADKYLFVVPGLLLALARVAAMEAARDAAPRRLRSEAGRAPEAGRDQALAAAAGAA